MKILQCLTVVAVLVAGFVLAACGDEDKICSGGSWIDNGDGDKECIVTDDGSGSGGDIPDGGNTNGNDDDADSDDDDDSAAAADDDLTDDDSADDDATPTDDDNADDDDDSVIPDNSLGETTQGTTHSVEVLLEATNGKILDYIAGDFVEGGVGGWPSHSINAKEFRMAIELLDGDHRFNGQFVGGEYFCQAGGVMASGLRITIKEDGSVLKTDCKPDPTSPGPNLIFTVPPSD